MNISEFMSFDLEWFTTLPGILITGGVVVLLVALILFIASNKKDKNNNQEVTPVDNSVPAEVETSMGTNIDNNVMMGAAVGIMNPMEPANNNIMTNDNINLNENFGVSPIENAVNDVPVVPTVEPTPVTTYSAQPAATNVVDFTTPSVETPVVVPGMNPVETTMTVTNEPAPEITSSEATVTANNMESSPSVTVTPAYNDPAVVPVEQSTPIVETPVVPVQEQPVIYGGANPASVNPTPVQEQPVIYGGANPLENTTTLPRITNHEAYGASNSNIIQPVVETPVYNEPAVVPVEQSTPVVETPVAFEPVTQPVEPVAPQVEMPAQSIPDVPTSSVMPMTGAEMFANPSPEVSDEIETLEF